MSNFLFLSDIHLSPERPAAAEAFCAYLSGPARRSSGLYILGDLFDFWIGDDAPQPSDLPVIAALRDLTQQGIPVWVMQGNHDFLYGTVFMDLTGCCLLPDPCVVDIAGTPTLLTHGDLLCTADEDYQRLRKIVRDPAWQAMQLAKPVEMRLAFAKALREQSRQQTVSKDPAIMDVVQSAVTAMIREHGVSQLIHGHTHRPGLHSFLLAGQEAKRWVLPAWLNITMTPDPTIGFLPREFL